MTVLSHYVREPKCIRPLSTDFPSTERLIKTPGVFQVGPGTRHYQQHLSTVINHWLAYPHANIVMLLPVTYFEVWQPNFTANTDTFDLVVTILTEFDSSHYCTHFHPYFSRIVACWTFILGICGNKCYALCRNTAENFIILQGHISLTLLFYVNNIY